MAKSSIFFTTLAYSMSDQAIGLKDSFKRRRVSLKFGTGSFGNFDCARKVRLGRGSGAAAFQSTGRTRRGGLNDIGRRPQILRGKREGRVNILSLRWQLHMILGARNYMRALRTNAAG